MAKHLYIIVGCNGAGKTTASMTILPKIFLAKEFVNADEIAKGLSPFSLELMMPIFRWAIIFPPLIPATLLSFFNLALK